MKKLFLFLCLLQAISFADKIKMAVFQVDSKLLGVDQSKLVSEMLTAECAKNSQYEVVPWQEVGNALKLASDKSRVGELSSKNANIECTNSKCLMPWAVWMCATWSRPVSRNQARNCA